MEDNNETTIRRVGSIAIGPSQTGLEHAIRLFRQQAEQSEGTISQAETLIAYLEDTETTAKELPALLWKAEGLLIQGLELVIHQEQERITSMQEG